VLRRQMAESLGHDSNTLSGTHCLAGRPGNRTGCTLLAEGGRHARQASRLHLASNERRYACPVHLP